ncbi:MAG: DUF4956 domain-containing protein [bacterium]|nr:DUF4956 domain-containing protein [bacterium]
MRDLLYRFLYDGTSNVSPTAVLFSMALAFVLAMILYFVYRFTFSGVAYSKKFNISLVMMSLITAMVMNIIGSSVALSLGMVGALSIVRFRTAIKDPRDTAYIFWSICIGLGVGTSNYYIVCIGTICVAIVALLLSFTLKHDDSFLIIVRGNISSVDKVRTLIFDVYRACKLRSETLMDGNIELVYQVKMKKDTDVAEYEKLSKIKGITSVNMVAKNGEILG